MPFRHVTKQEDELVEVFRELSPTARAMVLEGLQRIAADQKAGQAPVAQPEPATATA